MSVCAVPRSIARSFENRPCSQSKIIAFSRVALGWSPPAPCRGEWRFYHRQTGCLPRRSPGAVRLCSAAASRAHVRPAPGERGSSTLRDLPLFVRIVLPAHGAELLDLELLGHRPLVLRGRVVRAAAVAAGHLDEVAHGGSLGRRKLPQGGPVVKGESAPRAGTRSLVVVGGVIELVGAVALLGLLAAGAGGGGT